jgi:molybdenum cofactor cytidylyltransferase
MKTMAVILAAGAAPKFAHAKALLEYEKDRSFLRSLALAFNRSGAEPLAVVGKDAEAVRTQHPDLYLVENPTWGEGLLSSVKAGVRTALEEGAEVIAIHPVDQPAIRAGTLKTLLGKAGTGLGIVPEFEGAPGVPLVLTRAGAEKLVALTGSVTSLSALASQLGLSRVPTKDPGVVVNINSPDTYQRIFGSEPKLAPPPKSRKRKAETAGD